MTYKQSLQYLNQFLNLEKITFHSNKPLWNLERMKLLLQWFGHPENFFLPVIIAGTKGKGSTGFFLESILRESGVKMGYYHSPHLEEPTERIRLSGRPLSQKFWCQLLEFVRRRTNRRKLPSHLGNFTYFEILTLMGILAFQKKQVRVGILEVGMGGKSDACNAVQAPIAIVTPISLDHEAILGPTVSKIAFEKAAVIHEGAHAVIAPQPPAAWSVLKKRIQTVQARLWKSEIYQGSLGLTGDYQKVNAGAALTAAQILKQYYGLPVTKNAVRSGLRSKNWPGRWEILQKNPLLMIDGAHNPASIAALVRNLKKEYPTKKRLLIFAVARDKKSQVILKLLSRYFSEIILTTIAGSRMQEIPVLLEQARGVFKNIIPYPDVEGALKLAYKLSDQKSLIVAAGSFYLIGKIRKLTKP